MLASNAGHCAETRDRDALSQPVQHREVEHAESELFLSYFKGQRLQYLSGGVATGFHHVEEEKRQSQLFQVKGKAGHLRLKQVKLSRESMNSGDVFILDTEQVVERSRRRYGTVASSSLSVGIRPYRGYSL
eukprot:5690540-Pleurochrysis_carterae.AAC.1